MFRLLLPLALAALPSMVAAQAYADHDSDTPRSNRIAAQTAPGVAAANRAVAGRIAPTGRVSPLDRAAYAEDLRTWNEARRMRRQTIRRDRAYYDRRQRAYADAMADWRAQTAACRRGNNRACRAPAPRVSEYM